MTPLRITFSLTSPLVMPEMPLHVDALLAFAAFRVAIAGMKDEQSSAEKDAAILGATEDLPLERVTGSDGQWCWKASQLFFTAKRGGIFWNHYVRRFEMNRWAADRERGIWEGKKEKLSIGTGHMKAFSLQQSLSHVDQAVGWCIGDKATVAAMLSTRIHALGRNTRQGWGRVGRVHVDDAPPEEVEHWRRRTLPASLQNCCLEGHFPSTAPVRAPYWDRSSRIEAYAYDASDLSTG